jgi:hypothetical protein
VSTRPGGLGSLFSHLPSTSKYVLVQLVGIEPMPLGEESSSPNHSASGANTDEQALYEIMECRHPLHEQNATTIH